MESISREATVYLQGICPWKEEQEDASLPLQLCVTPSILPFVLYVVCEPMWDLSNTSPTSQAGPDLIWKLARVRRMVDNRAVLTALILPALGVEAGLRNGSFCYGNSKLGTVYKSSKQGVVWLGGLVEAVLGEAFRLPGALSRGVC